MTDEPTPTEEDAAGLAGAANDRVVAFRAIDGDRSSDASEPHEDETPAAANDEAIRMKIAKLEEEHRDLDQAIVTMEERMPYDRLTIQRLKKRKLALKDQITQLHEKILPDIIA